MEMAGNVKLIPSLRKSLRARAMDRCLPTLETSKNLTVNQEVGGSNPPAPVARCEGPMAVGVVWPPWLMRAAAPICGPFLRLGAKPGLPDA